MAEHALFVPGQVYRRRDLHDHYGGQQQGGISTPSRHNLIFLFTGDAGQQHGYHDQWSADEIFLYTGEGQKGDMQYVSGNRAIRDHARDGKDLHLFKQDRKAYVRYIGQMVCTGSHYENAPDTDDVLRKAIVFELTPIEEFNQLQEIKDPELLSLAQESLATLRQKALDQSVEAVTPQERKSVWPRGAGRPIFPSNAPPAFWGAPRGLFKDRMAALNLPLFKRFWDGGPVPPVG